MTYFDPILSHFEDFGGNGSKWTLTKQKKTQTHRRGGMAPPAPGENCGPLKGENDLEGVNFFFEIAPDPGVPREGGPLLVGEGGPLRVREGGPERCQKKPMGFLGYRRKAVESLGRGVWSGLGKGDRERVREGGKIGRAHV